ncbi:MAG: hypothetical protein JWL64_233, partial [Frankiales bacterium]|nr:hypothetical protein [Frankiales bacterium]
MTATQDPDAASLELAPPRRRSRSPRALLGWPALLAVLAAVPSLVLAVGVIQQHSQQVFGADQAVIELSTREAADLNRTLGAYSRYGWNHAGPFWFYLLAVPYRLLGSDSLALALGVLLLQASVAALFVLAAERWLGRVASVAALAGVVLLYVGAGGEVMRAVWNPYALLLPLLLLLVLAAAAAGTGSPRALLAGALTATFLVQTHVGTLVPVAALAVTAGPAWAVVWWRRRGHRIGRSEARGSLALLAAVLLAWLPPVVQQLQPGTGNLTLMLDFARQPRSTHSLGEGVAGLGEQLLLLPSGGELRPDVTAPLHPGGWQAAAVLVFLAACLAVAVLAVRLHRPVSLALALLVVVVVAASLVSIRQIDGPVYYYLILWQSVLPLGLLTAAAGLVPV